MFQKITAEKIFLFTKASPFLSGLAILVAGRLIWVMAALTIVWMIATWQSPALIIGVFLAWVLQIATAFLFNRPRPYQHHHEKPLMRLVWRTPSFPSGHTTLACAMAAGVFAQDPLWGGVFFLIAALIALSRIAVGVHYFSDIFGGAVLGIGVATIVAKLIV